MQNILATLLSQIKFYKKISSHIIRVRLPILLVDYIYQTKKEADFSKYSAQSQMLKAYSVLKNLCLSQIYEKIQKPYFFVINSVFGKTMRRSARLSIRMIEGMQSAHPLLFASYDKFIYLFAAIIFGISAQAFFEKRDNQLKKKNMIIDEIIVTISKIETNNIEIQKNRYDSKIYESLKKLLDKPNLPTKLSKPFKDLSSQTIFERVKDFLVNNVSIRATSRILLKLWAEKFAYKRRIFTDYWSFHIHGLGFVLGFLHESSHINELKECEEKLDIFQERFGLSEKRDLQNLLLAVSEIASNGSIQNECPKMIKPESQMTISRIFKYGQKILKSNLGLENSKKQNYKNYKEKIIFEGKTNLPEGVDLAI